MVLDGERGRRPHWKSTEQLLTQAVSREIKPCVLFRVSSLVLVVFHPVVESEEQVVL